MKTNKLLITLLALIIAGLAFTPLSGASEAKAASGWPEFHGPERTNLSPAKNLLKKWPEGGPRKLWTYPECGRGYSGVSLAEGLIFTAGDVGSQEIIIALTMDGKLAWKAANGSSWRRSSPGSRATPTYSEGVIYHMNPNGRLAAYRAKSGKPLWDVDIKDRFNGRHGIWAFSENVMVHKDRVICMPGGDKGRVVALDKRTGKTIWANTDIQHSAAYCSGRIVTHAGKPQFLSLTQRSLVSVDVKTGALLWSSPFPPTSPQNALTPVFKDGYVFVACGHGTGGTLMKIDQNARTARTVWHRQDLDDCHSGAVLIDGRLYGTACRVGSQHFYCVDFLTGRTIKLDKTLGKVGITHADGKIYALNHRGTMYLIDVTPGGFEINSRFELKKKPTNSYLAHPVVLDGRLYIRCNQDLHVFDISAD